jgi:hypothetical protein
MSQVLSQFITPDVLVAQTVDTAQIHQFFLRDELAKCHQERAKVILIRLV